jgi:superfamily II DNA or RNA helicase
MSTLSQVKNQSRQQSLRAKQQEAVDLISTGIKGKLLYVLPGGYGKTKAALSSYAKARGMGTVNRLLIVAPRREQRTAWLNCRKDFDELGIDVLTYEYDLPEGGRTQSCSTDVRFSDWAIDRGNRNQCEVFVVTIQALTGKTMSQINELMAKGRWMVIAEECHHLACNATWGQAIESLNYEIMIGLSASPFRSKGHHVFSGIIEDESRIVYCSHEDGLQEGVIRPLKVKEGRYQVEFMEKKTGEKHVFKLSELAKYLYEHNLDLSEFEAKQDLRVLDQFVRPLFIEALDKLDELNAMHPGQHQMIVHAPSVLTAKTYCQWINLFSDTSTGPAAKWVGSGAENSDKDNDEIIAEFKANKFPVLVQVQMFGEGSDNVRASVGLWLSLIGSHNPSCYQGMVRHTRRNLNIPRGEDIAYLYIPEDAPGMERALEIQRANDYFVDPESLKDSESENSKDVQLELPTLDELERQIRAVASQLLDVVESAESIARKIKQVEDEVLCGKNIQSFASQSGLSSEKAEEIVLKLLEAKVEQIVRDSINTVSVEVSEQQAHDAWRQRVEQAVARIARYIAKKHHPVAVEQSTYKATVGALKKKINGILKRGIGNGKKREQLEIPDLKRQYDYLSKLAASINEDLNSLPSEFNI